MATYTKQGFADGTVLSASQLEKMENGILDAQNAADGKASMAQVNAAIEEAIGEAMEASY